MAKPVGDSESYAKLRRNIGTIGILLPIVLVIGVAVTASLGIGSVLEEPGILPSISAYYHSEMRNVFVGAMFIYAFFFFSYDPNYKKGNDERYAKIAALCAFLVGVFPTNRPSWQSLPPIGTYDEGLFGTIHLIAAAAFFAILALFCLKLFVMSGKDPDTLGPQKKKRNRVYQVCGWVIVGAMVLMLLYAVISAPYDDASKPLKELSPTFWLETVAIVAFGISWFTKGEGVSFLNDEYSSPT